MILPLTLPSPAKRGGFAQKVILQHWQSQWHTEKRLQSCVPLTLPVLFLGKAPWGRGNLDRPSTLALDTFVLVTFAQVIFVQPA